MKKLDPRFWKTLERHAANTEPDVSPAMFGEIVAGLQEHGIVGNKTVYLDDNKVVDGWQFLQACRSIDLKPPFAEMPKNIEPEAFVELMNMRRHQVESDVVRKVRERRERVAAARVAGKSLRTIAEEEGVSKKTVERDLEGVTVSGGETVTPPDGKIIGQDGRQQPATKPKPEPPVLCDRCKRVGARADCEQCAAKRKGKAETGSTPKPGKVRFNEKLFEKAFGDLTRVIDQRGNAMGKGSHHKKCQDILGDFLAEYKKWKAAS